MPAKSSASDVGFYVCLSLLGGAYIVLILAMLLADTLFTTPGHLLEALNKPEIRYAIILSMVSCSMTAILSPTIGARSAHGVANRRIMLQLARWIRMNGTSIPGYDESMPALLQLPNLTDAQLISAFASMRTVS